VAARLQTLAAPGSILVSDATFRLTNGFFEFGASGELTVKGKGGAYAGNPPLRGRMYFPATSECAQAPFPGPPPSTCKVSATAVVCR
jgi:hypothetical protein